MSQTYKKYSKEIINGRNRVIYTRSGSKAKYIKHKGDYIKLSEYKKMSGGTGNSNEISFVNMAKSIRTLASRAFGRNYRNTRISPTSDKVTEIGNKHVNNNLLSDDISNNKRKYSYYVQ